MVAVARATLDIDFAHCEVRISLDNSGQIEGAGLSSKFIEQMGARHYFGRADCRLAERTVALLKGFSPRERRKALMAILDSHKNWRKIKNGATMLDWSCIWLQHGALPALVFVVSMLYADVRSPVLKLACQTARLLMIPLP
eukprot:evm.model.scf_795.5 EVM.evm.TU.scf_795.5   scf_795:55560-57578(-)